VTVATSESRFFLPGDDREKLWRKTVATVGAERPIVRIITPDFKADPPTEGLLETSWEAATAPEPAGQMLSRAVVHAVPEDNGLWIELGVEGSLEPRLSNSVATPFAEAVSQSLASGDSEVQPVSLWWSQQTPASDRVAQVPVQLTQGSTQWQDSIVTLPPAYPSTLSFNFQPSPSARRFGSKIIQDYYHFYSCDSLVYLTGAVGAAALMANTGFDTTMQNAWQTSVAPTGIGNFFANSKPLGEGKYAVPIFGAAALTGVLLEGLPAGDIVGEWGSRSLRMFIVGAPVVVTLQYATGAPRPSENLPSGSDWLPFHHNGHGASGHAFNGAIPFIAAADMVENPWAKGGLYVCSTFTGFSRMTTDSHYPSQVFLGWYIALASSMAVNRTEIKFAGMYVKAVPLPIANASGMALEARW